MNSLIESLSTARIYDLEQPRFPAMPLHESHKRPGYGYYLHRRHRDTYDPARHGQRSGASGIVTMTDHTGTHIDALCHQACELELFGGVKTETAESPTGFSELGAETMPPLVARGVLLDIARHHGADRLPEHYAITADEMIACAQSQNTLLNPGDILLIRTGFGAMWNDEATYLRAAGVHKSGSIWAAEQGVAAVGADNMAWDTLNGDRDPETGSTMFAHVYLIPKKGVYIVENLLLEELSRDRVYEFAFIAAPLKMIGATGSPIRPLAIV
ncbi:MAG: cyclase family protein [Bryobacteraceae bacterium]|nr:cyclase family protein [Bryobacteraceae bacterium]